MNKLFIISLFTGLSMYVLAIIILPGFITDDFILFTYISQHPYNFFAPDMNVDFFLFARPFAYLTFWLDFHFFGTNAILMKFSNIIFFILSAALFYSTLDRILRLINIRLSKQLIFIGTLIYIVHPDSLGLIIWISNRPELLSIIFYLATILTFLLHFEKGEKKYLVISFISFMLMCFSKQQGIHLPAILLIFYFTFIFSKKYTKVFFVRIYFIVSITILLALSVLNSFLYKNTLPIVIENLWKKPFAIIGITLDCLQPYLSNVLYNYFLFNKLMAILFLFAIILLLLFIFRKFYFKLLLNRKIIFSLVLFYLISFFPRLYGSSEGRLNIIQIFWLTLILIILTAKLLKKYKLQYVIIGMIVINFVNLVYEINFNFNIYTGIEEKINSFSTEVKDMNAIILADDGIIYLPYQLHFRRTGQFGREPLSFTSIRFLSTDIYKNGVNARKIICTKTSDTVTIQALSEDIYLFYDESDMSKIGDIISTVASPSGRGYKTLKISLLNNINYSSLFYFNGIEWCEV